MRRASAASCWRRAAVFVDDDIWALRARFKSSVARARNLLSEALSHSAAIASAPVAPEPAASTGCLGPRLSSS